jgi:1-acyl-sn-glycerol-3-phosphate acyltransferase
MGQDSTAHARIVPAIHSFFIRYIEWSLARHFHAVRISKDAGAPVIPMSEPLVVYLNHASWWDPLMMMWLGKRLYPSRPQYGPIESAQLERYGIFKSLGVFGVERGTASGARKFLRVSTQILSQPGAMLWLTPQGKFSDVRERPVQFAAGIAHLACRMPNAMFVPLALEYGFGIERLPEVYVRFGSGRYGADLGESPEEAKSAMEDGLLKEQEALSLQVSNRVTSEFDVLMRGGGGASVPYDIWRRVKGALMGKKTVLNHTLP